MEENSNIEYQKILNLNECIQDLPKYLESLNELPLNDLDKPIIELDEEEKEMKGEGRFVGFG